MKKTTMLVAGLAGAALQAATVTESAREIPVAAEVDVAVVGGSAGGVAAALAAREAGASVFLAGGFPYLGEDMAGTLELGLAPGEKPVEPLVKELWAASSDTAHYAYTFDRPQPQGPWIYRNDGSDKLSEPGLPPSPADVVLFEEDVTVRCVLDEPTRVARLEALVMERRGMATEGVHVTTAKKSVYARGAAATDGVTATVTDGPFKGKTFVLRRQPKTWTCEGDYYRGRAQVVTYACDVDAELHKVNLSFAKGAAAKHQLVTRIWFRRADARSVSEPPSPLKVKRQFDAALVKADVRFLTGSPATDLLRDANGEVAGVVVANRSGRQAILAKAVVDATAYNAVTRFGKPVPGVKGTTRFSRVVVAGAPPKTDGVTTEELPQKYYVSQAKFSGRDPALAGQPVTARVYRCTFELPMADGSYRSFAAAEAKARDLTWTTTMLDDANLLCLVSPRRPSPARKNVYPIDGAAGLQDRIRQGTALGRAAAKAAKSRGALAGVTVETGGARAGAAETTAAVREELGGLRPYERGLSRKTIPSPARELPVLGEYDVVVVGAGSAGAPAAIAAGRAGAKTLAVEYLHVLGGVSTEGMILGYYDGNHCGFTADFKKAVGGIRAENRLYQRAEVLRRWAKEAGVETWHGVFGEGAYVKDGAVLGVVVVTPQGRGVVLAKSVVDGTGNADVAAAAGAETVFLGPQELALQSAGQAPQRLGRGGINSDFGFVNDPCAWDMWLFGLRARAGAPDAWDISQVADSRERRRIVPDLVVQGWDVVAKRGFPDTVVQALSRQDSHGYLVDDFCYVAEATPGERGPFNVNVPLRALLPKGLSNICAIGLGKGCARDVNPMARMQADLMNEGYAAGRAAARAAQAGGDFRKIDVKALQRHLVEIGNLRPEVLDWTPETDAELTDAQIAAHVATMTNHYEGSWAVMRYPDRALPYLREAYKKAVGKDTAAMQIYAQTLGILGDATGAKRLAEIVSGEKRQLRLRAGHCYGGGSMDGIGMMLALGRTKSKRALAPLLGRLAEVNGGSSLASVRAVTLGLEALGDPRAAEPLAKMLEKPGFSGWAVDDFRKLPPQGGYGLGPEMDRCLRELALARALLACGDWQGKGRAVYEAYARDPRGVLACHANAVLARYANRDLPVVP